MKTSNSRKPKLKPEMKWQKGQYARSAEFQFLLPYPFLLLCKLINIPPAQLLIDFMDNLSCSSWKREGRDKAKEKLIEYFIEHGYGRENYSVEDIKEIFREMDALGLVWPASAKIKLTDLSSKWRNKYYPYWFKKWYKKPGRKKIIRA